MDIMASIREAYPRLSKVQKRIADQCLTHPEVVSFQSLRELTADAKTTEATVLKFCAGIGCPGFLAMKRELREYVCKWVSPNDKLKMSIERMQDSNATLIRIIENEKQCLNLTFGHLDSDSLMTFVRAINEANRIFIAAHRLTNIISQHLEYQLQRIGFNAYRIDVADIEGLRTTLTRVEQGDLFILISFPTYASMTVSLAEYLRACGVPMLSITDSANSPIAEGARAVLTCNTDHEIFYNSITAAIALVEVVTSAVVLSNKERFIAAQSKLSKIEAHLGFPARGPVFTDSALRSDSPENSSEQLTQLSDYLQEGTDA